MSCEFCDGAGKALCRVELNGMVADVQIVNRKLVADLFRDYMEMEIKFCPMCGEPLTEPQPLTLDELRGLDGEPVYVVFRGDNEYRGWAFANNVIDVFEATDGLYPFTLVGKHLDAYRRPPKEATKT